MYGSCLVASLKFMLAIPTPVCVYYYFQLAQLLFIDKANHTMPIVVMSDHPSWVWLLCQNLAVRCVCGIMKCQKVRAQLLECQQCPSGNSLP